MQLRHKWLSLLTAIFGLVMAGSVRADDFPKGTFTNKDPEGNVWSMSFDGKGKLSVARGDKEVVKLDYKVTKDEIEFSHETGEIADKDAKPGTYKWKLDGKNLTFTKVKDDSVGRSQAITNGAWTKKEME